MEKLNYYDSDINMIWQSSPEESGEALKKLSKALASYNYEYEKVNIYKLCHVPGCNFHRL